ncbi:MAG TPA: PRC-barrel domain-containing protein [Gemmatimonadaceae bacterium]|nr:PRC-barrel domain-containing protein [Gemmatimonadaceae bacterium]
MMSRELLLSDLIGRQVRDADGIKVGRIEELLARIELHEHGNDYVVVEFHVGAYGLLEGLTGGVFAQKLVQRMGSVVGYRRFRIPWEWMELSDPLHPRLNHTRAELETRSVP